MQKVVGISESIGLIANVNLWYLIEYICFYVIYLSCECIRNLELAMNIMFCNGNC